MKLRIKKGLDVPLAGKPTGESEVLPTPQQIALNLDPFDATRFKVHVKAGEKVRIGQPLVENKGVPGQFFVSPAGGVLREIRRGLKRRLLDLVIDVDANEEHHPHQGIDLASASREEILAYFMATGLFAHIRLRPFNLVPDPALIPRDIFIRAIETLPFAPSAAQQLSGHESAFQAGIDALRKLTDGSVHLVAREETFTEFTGVDRHTAEGPHPAGTSSLHIHKIAPIQSPDDYVWTLSTVDVITIGTMVSEGRYFTDRILAVAGSGVVDGRQAFLKGRQGFPVEALIAGRLANQPVRLISGSPLTGTKVEANDFLGFYDTTLSVIPENTQRQLLHFFRPGFGKYTATKTYATGHVKPPKQGYAFTTNQHGEERAFIDGAIYERIMPMKIPTMHLVKAILAEDFELAEQLGLLEVDAEDFALASFICPSKIEMMEIVKTGLRLYSKEMGH